MRSWCIILLFLYRFSSVVCVSFTIDGQRKFTLDYNNCAGRKPPIILSILGIKWEGHMAFGNVTLDVQEDILTDPSQLFEITRCEVKENLDTCEPFVHMKYSSLCNTFKLPALRDVYNMFDPEMKCPIKKNLYRVTNAELDLVALIPFPTQRWYWRMKIMAWEKVTNRTLLCCMLGIYYPPNR